MAPKKRKRSRTAKARDRSPSPQPSSPKKEKEEKALPPPPPTVEEEKAKFAAAMLSEHLPASIRSLAIPSTPDEQERYHYTAIEALRDAKRTVTALENLVRKTQPSYYCASHDAISLSRLVVGFIPPPENWKYEPGDVAWALVDAAYSGAGVRMVKGTIDSSQQFNSDEKSDPDSKYSEFQLPSGDHLVTPYPPFGGSRGD